MKIWTAFIEKDKVKYFICQGKNTEILGIAARKIADLELSSKFVREIQYEKMEVPWDMKNIEELT